MNYKISIITINYNNLSGLENTLFSIKAQQYEEIELIIVDGNSTDGSVDFLKKHVSQIDHLVIENDKGIYDAMNKGLDLASGDFCIFLNSGDYFFNNLSLKSIVQHIDKKNHVYFSQVKICSSSNSWLVPNDGVDINKWLKKNSPNHQTILFPKEFYAKNRYDLFYKIVGDVDYIRRAYVDFTFIYIPFCSTIFNLGGVSNDTTNFKRIKRQILESVIVHLKYFPHKMFYLFYVPFKFTVKYFLGFIMKNKYDWVLKTINKLKHSSLPRN